MLLNLLIIKEVVFIIAFLSIPIYVFYQVCEERKQKRERKFKLDELPSKVADMLMENASDDNFIVLNVRQDKLIEKTADEIERRKAMRGNIYG